MLNLPVHMIAYSLIKTNIAEQMFTRYLWLSSVSQFPKHGRNFPTTICCARKANVQPRQSFEMILKTCWILPGELRFIYER